MRDDEKARLLRADKDALLRELDWIDRDMGSVNPMTSTYAKMLARRVWLEARLEKRNGHE